MTQSFRYTLLAFSAAAIVCTSVTSAPAASVTNHVEEAGPKPTLNNTWAAAPVDADGDGDEDVWIGYHQAGVVKGTSGAGRLWSNDGSGHYTWVARAAWPRVNANGRITDRHDCQPADVDLDGDQDFYCSAGRNESNRVKTGMDNELWLQDRVNHYVEVGTRWGVGDVCGRGRHVAWIDANGDPYPDLFLGNEVPRHVEDRCDDSTTLPNEESKLFLNDAGTGFTYVRKGITGLTGAGQRCAEVLDLERDGDQDLLACRLKGQHPLLYRNNANDGFTEVSSAWNLSQAVADVVAVDLNGDGRTDVVEARKASFAYQLNTGSRFAAPITIASVARGEGRSVAVGDADSDGDLDVYGMIASKTGNPADALLINQGDLRFARLSTPAATGEADEVVPLHPTADGHTEFLSLNGGGKTGGSIQLLTLVP